MTCIAFARTEAQLSRGLRDMVRRSSLVSGGKAHTRAQGRGRLGCLCGTLWTALLVARAPLRWSGLRAFAVAGQQASSPPSAADVLDEVVQAAQKMEWKLTGKLANYRKQLSEKDPADAEEWQKKGDALVKVPRGQWHKGLTEYKVPDYTRWDSDGNPQLMLVELDPDKDFQANAKLCFKKASKITRALQKLTPMIEETEVALSQWSRENEAAKRWQAELAETGALTSASEHSIHRLHESLLKEGLIQLPASPEEEVIDTEAEAKRKFKRKFGKDIDCFLSPSGHEVVAGRSSKMNEHVSLKLAKGDMPWFHSDNGIPGSHVLIRAPWNDCTREDIEFAAKIAAYHSKGRERGLVPVMYCEGGGVRKPPRSRTGTVTTTGKCYRLSVTPELPED